MVRGTLDGAAVVVHDAHALCCQHGDVAVHEEKDLTRVLEQCRDVAGHEVFFIAESNYRWRAQARRNNLLRIFRGDEYQGVDAA